MILIYSPARSVDCLGVDGRLLASGDLIAVSEQRGNELLEDPDAEVAQVELDTLKVDQLSDLAEQIGVKSVQKLRSKQALLDAIAQTLHV